MTKTRGPEQRARLLVSLCNTRNEQLVVVDAGSSKVTPLPVASGGGTTGLCRVGDEILIAGQTAEASVVVLDARTLRLRREVPLPGARDVHSLVRWRDGVAVASSGTDEVLWYHYDGSRFADRTVLWQAGGARNDTVHVNGLAAHGDALICCAFGPRRSQTDLWSESQAGFVYDVVNQTMLLDGLGHPHSVAFLAGELFLCESSSRRFRSLAHPIATLPGYARGVASLGSARMVVGTSRARMRSRSSGRLLNPADHGIEDGVCALHVVDLDGAVRELVSLGDYGTEIYDVLRLS